MSKFCTKCGKPLEEGKPCKCQANAVNESVAGSTASGQTTDYVNTFIEMAKGIFLKPISTIKKYSTQNNFVVGLIAILINSIVSGLLLYFIAKEAMGALNIFGSYGGLLGMTTSIEIPFMKTLLYGIIFMLAGFATTAAVIYAIAGPLFKDKIDLKKVTSLIGTCSVFTTITTLIAILFTFISIKVTFIILLIAGIFYLTYLYHGIKETTEVEDDKLAYVFVPAISVATFVVVYILPKILF